jgi:hypothetical protein
MKFLNLSTGYSFDGLWEENQSKGYIFWFPNEQSIDLTYTMPIAAITESEEPLYLTIEDNDIFSFIQLSENKETIDSYTFDGKPIYTNSYITVPEKVNNKYIHVFNIACCSKNANEYICKVNIADKGFIRVGADFYGEHEPAYINLSNMGVEISQSVQRAIYDSNVHEDITDNILINRKLKELLSNYWDIIANKGSYKSLLNSLKWFEWNEHLQLREIYKYYNVDKVFFSDKDLVTTINETIEESLKNYIKTTYIALYSNLYIEKDTFDCEYNPELEQVVFKWSLDDIKLKLALLVKYFDLYFLPIHISVLHATVESKVFTNTIKAICNGDIKRIDDFADFNYIKCNISDNDIFTLTNVKAQVTDNTVFGIKYPETGHFGVDSFEAEGIVTEDSIKTFSEQYYVGPGAIIPIKLIIPNRTEKEFIKQAIIDYTDDSGNIVSYKFYNIFNTVQNNDGSFEIPVNFNFLAKVAREYNLRFTFILSTSKTITRTVKLNVEDIDNININVYKVKSKIDIDGFTYDDFYNSKHNKYFFRLQSNAEDITKSYYIQYLPYILNTSYDYTGIKLNRTVVIDVKDCTDAEISYLKAVMKNYLCFNRYNIVNDTITDNIKYLVFVSKYFFEELPDLTYNKYYKYKIIRNDLGFYPQFHYMERIGGDTIDDYTILPSEAICCAVEINNGAEIEDFKYGHLIESSEWTFYNNLTNESISLPKNISVKQPFIASTDNILSAGYYDIVFKYKLNNELKEYRLNSAFRIKD